MEKTLAALTDDEVRAKQAKVAEVAHRFVLQLKDAENDAMDIWLKRQLADAITLSASTQQLWRRRVVRPRTCHAARPQRGAASTWRCRAARRAARRACVYSRVLCVPVGRFATLAGHGRA